MANTKAAASYHDVADALRSDIAAGRLAAGDPMPSQSQIADQFSVGPSVARMALDQLVTEGLITSGRGRGRRVRDRSPLTTYASRSETRERRSASGVDAWLTDVQEQGYEASQTIKVEVVEADSSVAEWLAVPAGSLVAVRRRLRTVGGEPDNLADSYYPFDLTKQVPEVLNPADVPQGVIALMRERGYEQVRYRDELRWRPATPEESSTLSIPRGVAVLIQARVGYVSDGTPVRVTVTTLPGDRHVMVYELPA